MFKYLFGYLIFKKRGMVITFLFVLALTLIVTFSFSVESLQRGTRYDEHVSFYEEVNFDYLVQFPKEEQVSELKALDSIDQTKGIYAYNGSLFTEDDGLEVRSLFSDDENNMDITPYYEKRVIKSGANDYDSPLYIDREVAESLDVEIGDEVDLTVSDSESMTFQIASIFKNNLVHSRPAVFFVLDETTQSVIDEAIGDHLMYSFAYVDSNNPSRTYEDLQDYKPLANKKTEDDFASEELYEEYLDDFDNYDYRKEMYILSDRYEEAQDRYDSDLDASRQQMLLSAFSLGGIGIFSVFLAFMYKREIIVDILKRGSRPFKILLPYSLFTVVLFGIIYGISYTGLKTFMLSDYIALEVFNRMVVYHSMFLIIGGLLTLGLLYLILHGIARSYFGSKRK